jgi:hypothetical protein
VLIVLRLTCRTVAAIRDIATPPVRPHSDKFIYRTNYQSQIDALRAALPKVWPRTAFSGL